MVPAIGAVDLLDQQHPAPCPGAPSPTVPAAMSAWCASGLLAFTTMAGLIF